MGWKDAPIVADNSSWKDAPEIDNSTSWSSVPGQALMNTPRSALNMAKGVIGAITHPIDTAGNLLDVAAGGLHNLVPASVSSAIDRTFPSDATAPAIAKADAAGQFYKNRYGSMEGLKNTLATDPVGALSDASAILTGGGALASKIPGLGKVAAKTSEIGNAINPVNVAAKAVPIVGDGVANIVGGLGTHTGGESLKQAAKSGFEGGGTAKSFADNMRGNVPMTDVLETAKQNLQSMGQAKAEAYRNGMAQVSGDKSVLNFDGIDKALSDAYKTANFKGQSTNTKASQAYQEIADAVNNWKNLDPAEYHTPEGLDALKKQIGGIQESIPFEQKTARKVAGNIYNAVKNEITKQAPVYADTMKGYQEASDQITEIERALSLGGKAAADTSMRKLQSLMRNNVNTNYGNRLDLAKQLEQQGGRDIMPALAGQTLTSLTPRGLGGAVASGLGMGGYAIGGLPVALPTLAAQSPRLMGETAFKLGQGAGLLGKAAKATAEPFNIDPATLANYLSLINRPNQ